MPPLGPATILYAAALAVLGAACAGIVPALKVTGGRIETRLRRTTAGAGRPGFGGVWTAVIVAQVAMTVAFPATTFFVGRSVVQIQTLDVGFPSEEYLSVRLEMDDEIPPGTTAERFSSELSARFDAACLELERRLAAEPGVAGVTFTSVLPRTLHRQRWVEVDGEAAPSESGLGHRTGSVSIAPDYFDVLGAGILAGRAFHAGDVASGRPVVVVNQSFVRRVFEGRNPVGRRVRYAAPHGEEPGPWYEIVGTVRDLGTIADPSERSGIYHPMAPGKGKPVHLAVHVKGDPESFAARFHAVAAGIDPALRLHDLLPLDKVGSTLWLEFGFLDRLLVAVSSIALLLSLAGIYSIMSFTVSRRTRESGSASRSDRAGGGSSDPFSGGRSYRSRSASPTAGRARPDRSDHRPVAGESAIVVAYMALMMAVCMLACIVPTRRALKIEPSEALRADG